MPAAQAGDATMLLGSSCSRPMTLGYDTCQLQKGQPLPELRLYFFNAAEYAVSDCRFNILKTGSVDKAGEVVIDLSGLNDQVAQSGFCMLRLEAIEKYPSTEDPNQKRQIAFAGGFFIELLDPEYFPVPSDATVSWCYQISGTNKGRRKMSPCS